MGAPLCRRGGSGGCRHGQRHGYRGGARFHFLQALHDHLLAAGQAAADDPAVALGALGFHRQGHHLAVGQHCHHHFALGGTDQGPLRHGEGLFIHGLLHFHPHEHSRQQHAVGIGHFGPQQYLAGARVHGHFREQQLAFVAIGGAVFQQHPHLGAGAGHGVTLAAETQHFAAGLGEVHVDGIELFDGGQVGGFVLAHQRAFGHQRAPDATRYGCAHGGVVQIDAGAGVGSPGSGHIGFRLLGAGEGLVVFLGADRIARQQILQPCLFQIGLGQIRLGPRHVGFGGVQHRPQGGGIDLEQQVAGLDLAAFGEQPFLYDAFHPRPYFRRAAGLHPSR